MSNNGQDHQLPEPQERAEGGQDEDDEFGEFEGFEGGVERMQAQPAPSPWATFPDLLPVQSSPATPADDANQPSTSRANQNPPNGWQGGANGWAAGHDEARPAPQQMRTLNPPDVSLGTNQAVGGRITPDNVHDLPPDAALAVVMDHLDNNADALRPAVAQMERLNEQLESAEQSRGLLEGLVQGLRERNAELEQQVAGGQAQIDEMHARMHRNQETLEQRLSEIQQFSSVNWRQDLRQIQEEIVAIKQSQIAERTELQASRQSLEEMRTGISNRLQVLESNIQREYLEMERRLSQKFDEQCQQVKAAVESVVQQTAQHVSGNLSQLVCEAVQSSGCGDSQGNNLLQSIKLELEKHKDQQKRVLEEERQRQLMTLSSALQSALQHLNSAINSEPSGKDGNKLL